MHRFVGAVLGAAIALTARTGAALAAKPVIEIVDVSQFEEADEAILAAECLFPVDAEYEGQFIVHAFTHGRLVEIINYRTFQTFSANGITWTALHPDSGPDIVWIEDRTTFVAIVGRSITGSSVIGRTVIDLGTGEVLSSSGLAVDWPLDDICAMLTP